MKIVYSKEFAKELKKLPVSIQRLYRKQEDIFRENWRDPDSKLRSSRTIRFRFHFESLAVTALFATIGHRKDVYD